jgi:hypothetical protein
MIGGFDVVIPVHRPIEGVKPKIIAAFRSIWPEMVLEDLEEEPGRWELFIHKDQLALDRWAGGEEERAEYDIEDMVQVIWDRGEITLVFDREGKFEKETTQKVCEALLT